jgi:hypothetical protein
VNEAAGFPEQSDPDRPISILSSRNNVLCRKKVPCSPAINGPEQIESLRVLTLHGPENIQLFGCLNPLGNHIKPQFLPQSNDRSDNCPVIFVKCQGIDKGPIDLKPLYGKVA